MDAVSPVTAQVVHVDAQEKQHLEDLAQNVTLATDQKTGVPQIQPVFDQHPLSQESVKEVEDFPDQSEPAEKESKLSYLIPALQKRVRTTKAANFLGKKMEWLGKKSGGNISLK